MSNEHAVAPRQQQSVQVQEARGEIQYVPFAAADPIKLSIAIVKKWLCKPTKSGAICTDSDAMRFMMMCQARRLNPFEGDAHLVGYDGKNGPEFSLITAHQALAKRAEPQPSFKGIDSGVIVSPGWECRACESGFKTLSDGAMVRCQFCRGTGVIDEVQGDMVPPNQKLVGGWAHLERSDRSIPIHRRLNVEAYRPAYANKFWEQNPAGQIVKCAEADALRSAYPTLVGGLYTEGESGFAMVAKEIGGSATAPAALAPPQQSKRLTAPAAMPRAGGNKPTLVEEPIAAPAPDEQAESDMGLAPAAAPLPTPPAPKHEPGPSMTAIQKQLTSIVCDAGYTFDEFRTWGRSEFGDGTDATGVLAWDSMTGFEDVPDRFGKFCVRARDGLLGALKQMREGGAS